VIIDELFHTTNPPDAATASEIFLSQLWNSERATSIVSTHLFSHASASPPHVQRLCVQSILKADKRILYTYKVVPGMNTMSSVKELLDESGVSIESHNAVSNDPKTSTADIENNAE
jgi:DNA mismatch repair ATPase MutS